MLLLLLLVVVVVVVVVVFGGGGGLCGGASINLPKHRLDHSCCVAAFLLRSFARLVHSCCRCLPEVWWTEGVS